MQLIGLCLAAAVLVLLAVEGWLLIHLLRQNGRLLLRIEVLESQILAGHGVQPQRALVTTPDNSKGNKMGLPIGAEAPMGLWGSDIQGKRLSLKSFCATDKPSLFLFSDPKCGPCLAMMRSVANWQREYARFLNIVVVSQGERETNRAKAIEHGLQNVMIQVGKEVSSAYKVFGTPSAVLILANGRIGTQTVGGVEAISQLVQDSIPIVPANATVALSGNKVLGRPGVRYERLDEEAV